MPASSNMVAMADGGGGVRIEPWAAGDLPLLRRLLGDPLMTVYLGGPEGEAKLIDRQARYEQIGDAGAGGMFKIIDPATGEAVGSVGYWEKAWRDAQIYETGWMVLREFQGRGMAGLGTAAVIAAARNERKHRFLHAFPSTENLASNAICRKLGFTLLEACEFEYPPGHRMSCNDWRFDLFAER